MNMDLKNQSVLITGSSSGIGRGISDAFLKENTLTILTGRDKKTLKNTTLKLSNLYGKDKVFSFLGDLSIPDKVQSLYDYIGETLGHLNHLVWIQQVYPGFRTKEKVRMESGCQLKGI